MTENNIIMLNQEDLVETGYFSMDQIQRSKHSGDGYVGTVNGTPYFFLEAELNLETGRRTVELGDIQGEGKNRKGPNSASRL